MMNPLSVMTLLAFSSTLAMANTYNFETDLSYTHREIGNSDAQTTTLKGAYYFGGVDDSKGPLAEAAFVDRASSIAALYGFGKTTPFDDDLSTFGIGGRYVGKNSGIFVDLSYLSNTIAEQVGEESRSVIAVEGGMYIGELGRLTIGLANNEIDQSYGSDESANNLFIRYKQLIQFSGENSLNLEGFLGTTDFEDSDDLVELALATDYYFNRFISIGADLAFVSVQANEDTPRYGINAQWFLNNHFSIYGEASRIDYDAGDIGTYIVGLQGRF